MIKSYWKDENNKEKSNMNNKMKFATLATFAAIAGLYSHQNARNDKRIEELIEKGIDLEKEYEKIMNKSSGYSKSMRDLIISHVENKRKENDDTNNRKLEI